MSNFIVGAILTGDSAQMTVVQTSKVIFSYNFLNHYFQDIFSRHVHEKNGT